jgi:hypothetical protein
VYERERERERECVCVWVGVCEREREKERASDTARGVTKAEASSTIGKLPKQKYTNFAQKFRKQAVSRN